MDSEDLEDYADESTEGRDWDEKWFGGTVCSE